MNATTHTDVRRPSGGWLLAAALLLMLGVLAYPACYVAARVSHAIVHVHWGALGRGGCSHLEPSGGAFIACAWVPAISAETAMRSAFDRDWGSCPDVTE